MINIISRSLIENQITGPKKVVINLIKGLDKIGYPYVINQRLDACERLWIHDDIYAVKEIEKLPRNIKVILGPNLYVLPRHIPCTINFGNAVYIHPSKWAADMWNFFNYRDTPLDFWPTGIDTDSFFFSNTVKKEQVLIYFKDRYKEELESCEKKLNEKNIPYTVITYGSYTENQYRNELQKSKYVIWIGRQESQGIALQEALAMNVTIIVWDVENFGHSASAQQTDYYTQAEKNYTPCTSIPYFDETCGVVIKSVQELDVTVDLLENNLEKFQPRNFIIKNLSLEKQAKDFLKLYEKHFGLTYEQGLQEKQIKKGLWINHKWYYVLFIHFKNFIKKIIRKQKTP